MTVGRFTQLSLEIAAQPTAPNGRVSALALEVANTPSTPNAIVTSVSLEIAVSGSAVVTPDPTPTGSSGVWSAFVDNTDTPNGGKNSLVIELNDGQNLSYNSSDPWFTKTVYSALMSCSYPNFIAFGGWFNFKNTNTNADFLFIQRVGVTFYASDLTIISSDSFDASDVPTNAWTAITQQVTPVPTGAAFFRYFCSGLVSVLSNVVGTVSTGTAQNYATMMFDDLYAIQEINASGVQAPGGGGGGTGGTTGITPPVIVAGRWHGFGNFFSGPGEPSGESIGWQDQGLSILWADGSSTVVPSQNAAVFGLSAGTYYFYPFWDVPTQTLQFVRGGEGVNASGLGAGSAFTSPSASALQTQNLDTHVPLSVNGPLSIATGGNVIVTLDDRVI